MSAPAFSQAVPSMATRPAPAAAEGVRLSLVWVTVAIFALLAATVAHFVTRSDTLAWAAAYADVLARLKTEGQLTEELDAPIVPVADPRFEQPADDTAWLKFPVRGQRSTGEVTIQLQRDGDRWVFRGGTVRLDGGKTVALKSETPVTAPPQAGDVAVLPAVNNAGAPATGEADAPPSPIVVSGNDALTLVETPAAPVVLHEHRAIVGVIPGAMQFEPRELTFKAGEAASILFINKACPLQHNLVILKPGTADAYGRAADALMAKYAADAMAKSYIPDDPAAAASVVARTSKLIGTGQSEVIKFTVPSEPGDYPFLCTFPGHRFSMNGKLTVVP